ncbi:hypothetical protein LguiB_001756 [Lonicera macranthoides]
MLAFSVILIFRLDPLRYLFEKPVLTNRITKWVFLLSQFDILYITQKAVKGQVIADHLAGNPIIDTELEEFEFPDEGIMEIMKNDECKMYFDGACNRNGNGIEILLISLDQTHAPMSFRLEFPFTNNITEYEACIVELKIALQKGVRKIQVFGDSALIIHQIMTKWKIKEEKLVPFLAQLEETSEKFNCIEFFYIPRTQNNFANALATLASMIEIPGEKEEIQIQIQKRANSVFRLSLDVKSGNVVEPSVWYYDICHLLKHNEYPPNTNKATRVALR